MIYYFIIWKLINVLGGETKFKFVFKQCETDKE